MKYNPNEHHRRSLRLRGYEYSQPGGYFITVCTHIRRCMFGNVMNGNMVLNDVGKLIEYSWLDLPNHISNIAMDMFVIMPNHIHGIIFILAAEESRSNVGAGSKPAPQETDHTIYGLPEIVRQFKTFSAKRINSFLEQPGQPIWQRSYYDHIIRDNSELNCIRQYIINNPMNWERDEEYTEVKKIGLSPNV